MGQSERRPDVVIVGGGVMGCALAYFLARDGVLVTLLERNAIGAVPAASGASAAMVDFSIGDVDQGRQAVLTHALLPELAEDVRGRTGIDVQLTQPGLLRIGAGAGSEATLREAIGRYAAVGQRAEWLDAKAARQAEPGLSAEITGAVFCAELKEPVCAAVRAGSGGGGGFLWGHREARRTGDRLRAARGPGDGCGDDGRDGSGGARGGGGGAWTGRLSAGLGLDVPIGPQRGQIMALQPLVSAVPVRHMLVHGEGVVAPKSNRTVVVGSTREFVGWEGRITGEGVAYLLDVARQVLPSLLEATVKHVWYGFRPMRTDGGRPLVGPVPGLDNVSIVSGHNSVGVMLSAGVGRWRRSSSRARRLTNRWRRLTRRATGSWGSEGAAGRMRQATTARLEAQPRRATAICLVTLRDIARNCDPSL